jgi:hypothetical protein
MTDGIDLLVEDHREVSDLFERYRGAPDDGGAHSIFDRLAIHARMEDLALYPAVRRLVDGGDDLVDQAQSEASAIQTIVAHGLATPPPDLAPLVDDLANRFTEHARFVERDMFPPLRESGADIAALGDALERARDDIPNDAPRQV